MKGFIEVTLISNSKALIRVTNISFIQESDELTFISLSDRELKRKHPSDLGYLVKESYEEVVEKIRQAIN